LITIFVNISVLTTQSVGINEKTKHIIELWCDAWTMNVCGHIPFHQFHGSLRDEFHFFFSFFSCVLCNRECNFLGRLSVYWKSGQWTMPLETLNSFLRYQRERCAVAVFKDDQPFHFLSCCSTHFVAFREVFLIWDYSPLLSIIWARVQQQVLNFKLESMVQANGSRNFVVMQSKIDNTLGNSSWSNPT
jgi:hypothetical protein